jgi:hypothetical protein
MTSDITAVPEPVNVALGIFGGVFVLGGLNCWAGVNHFCPPAFPQSPYRPTAPLPARLLPRHG